MLNDHSWKGVGRQGKSKSSALEFSDLPRYSDCERWILQLNNSVVAGVD
jgi:hypothetical protein